MISLVDLTVGGEPLMVSNGPNAYTARSASLVTQRAARNPQKKLHHCSLLHQPIST